MNQQIPFNVPKIGQSEPPKLVYVEHPEYPTAQPVATMVPNPKAHQLELHVFGGLSRRLQIAAQLLSPALQQEYAIDNRYCRKLQTELDPEEMSQAVVCALALADELMKQDVASREGPEEKATA